MAIQGKLTLSEMGYSMPVDAPAYARPPFHYRNARSIAVSFETEADAVLPVLPSVLALADPPIAVLSFYEYPWSTFGPYREAILSLAVEHRGRALSYIQQIVVTTEPPMLGGREIWGFPKKLASVELRAEADAWLGAMERPAGLRLASAVVRPERPAPTPSGPGLSAASLRLIPGAEAGAPPVCAEIIETVTETRVHEAWQGTGSVSFPEHSGLDPWDRFPVRRIVGASYQVYDMLLPAGRVLERLA